MGNEPNIIPPSESFQARNQPAASANYKQLASSNYQEKAQPTPTPSTSGSSIAVVVLLSFIFITNVLVIVLLALLVAKVWVSSTIFHSVVFGDNTVGISGYLNGIDQRVAVIVEQN
jgi:hypothetical protein